MWWWKSWIFGLVHLLFAMSDLGARWMCIYSPACMVVMFQKFQCKSSFAQVIIEHTCGEVYKYVQGSPVEIQAPWNGNPICCSMTTPVSVLSPSGILPASVLCPDACMQGKTLHLYKKCCNSLLLHTPENVLFWTYIESRSVCSWNLCVVFFFFYSINKGNGCRIWSEMRL